MEWTAASWALGIPNYQTRRNGSDQPQDTKEPDAGRYYECRQPGRNKAAPEDEQGTPPPSENSLRSATKLILSDESDGCALHSPPRLVLSA
jgi:hypothetical protein